MKRTTILIALFAVSCASPPDGDKADMPADGADTSVGGPDMSADEAPWPNDQVSRTATSGSLDQCHSEADAADYLGEYKVETNCGDGGAVVISVNDVWFEPEVGRPRVNDTLEPATYPALLGTVSLVEGDVFWANAYFYGQCNLTGMFPPPPGGIAFDLDGPQPGSWISCYAGIGSDAGESESCVMFVADGAVEDAKCSVSATPN